MMVWIDLLVSIGSSTAWEDNCISTKPHCTSLESIPIFIVCFTYLNIVININQCQEQIPKLYINKKDFEKAYIDQLY